MRKQLFIVTCSLLTFCLAACGNSIPTEETAQKVEQDSLAPKLEGYWIVGIEPGCIQLKANGHYEELLPTEDGTAPEKGAVAISGTWKIKGQELVLTTDEGIQARAGKITWENDSLFFLGDYHPSDYEVKDQLIDDRGWQRFIPSPKATSTTTVEQAPSPNNKATKMASGVDPFFVGSWDFRHEPGTLELNANGTYREYTSVGRGVPDQIYERGTWTAKEQTIYFKNSRGNTRSTKITIVNNNLIYLGDLEEEHDEAYGNKEEFAVEMGWHRQQK